MNEIQKIEFNKYLIKQNLLNSSNPVMQVSDITHAKLSSEHSLELKCDLEGDKLILHAVCDQVMYQGEKQLDPDIDFEDIRQSISCKQYKIVSKTPEILKLKVGFLNLELKNKEVKLINELQKSLADLTLKYNFLVEQNSLLKQVTKQLKHEINLLVTKISDLAEKVNSLTERVNENEQKNHKCQQVQLKQLDVESKIIQKDHKKENGEMKQIEKQMQTMKNDHNENLELSVQHQIKPQKQKIISRTAICIEATNSMQIVFQVIVTMIKNVLPDIYEVLRQARIDGSFEIKFVIYRNYNATEDKLIEFSNFSQKSDVLLKWIQEIKIDDVWKKGALEICLNHLNSVQNLHQFIIIGDSKAYTRQQVIIQRKQSVKRLGRQWDKNGFKETYYEQELQELIKKKIKGHCYYLNPEVYTGKLFKQGNPKQFFEDLSKRTGGSCEEFNINDPNATKLFSDFVANRILQNIGDLYTQP